MIHGVQAFKNLVNTDRSGSELFLPDLIGNSMVRYR